MLQNITDICISQTDFNAFFYNKLGETQNLITFKMISRDKSNYKIISFHREEK